MTLNIERKVRARLKDDTLTQPAPLSNYQDTPAWVLLGDPGAGKTTTFKTLAALQGHQPVTARDFIELEPPPGGYPTPIFIDGLDEYAAGTGNGYTAMGRIRQRLDSLGRPPFRLSCREADWRGSTDSAALQSLVGEGQFVELHLAPLDDEQILKLAAHWLASSEIEASNFVQKAKQNSLEGLLSNPQTLLMLIKAAGCHSGNGPNSKAETYQLACAVLVNEQNDEHRAVQRDRDVTNLQVVQAAAYLCAVMLLSGRSAITRQNPKNPNSQVVALNELIANSATTPSLAACLAALHTHLFVGDGMGHFAPAHRTIAEYLGATFLAARIKAQLPASRVLALIQGDGGGVVPALRGLHAWLAVLADDAVRRTLIDQDPLGLVLQGDVRGFSAQEKADLLQALQQEATRYANFRSQNWASHPFGALATPDMLPHFKERLQSPERSAAHQAVLDCVLDAMTHGQPMQDLAGELERIVADTSYWPRLRRRALQALCAWAGFSQDTTIPLRILETVHQGEIEDSDNDLLGVLLSNLFPRTLPPHKLWRYYKPYKPLLINEYFVFWHSLATRYAPREALPPLMDGLLASSLRLHGQGNVHDLSEIFGALLYEAVVHFAEHTPVARVYQWFTLGMGVHSDNCLAHDKKTELGQWLTEHPELYRQLLAHGYTELAKSSDKPDRCVLKLNNLLCNAQAPSNAATWYWELANAHTGALRQPLIYEAFTLTQHRDGANAALERLQVWTQQHPQDVQWGQAALLSCPYPPDAFRLKWIDQEIASAAEKSQENKEELTFLSTALPQLSSVNAHLGLLHDLGRNYLYDHSPNASTPNETLLKRLHNNKHWLGMALEGLRYCLLERVDLPTAQAILALHRKGQIFTTSTPLLAAMHLRYTDAPATALDLDDTLLQQLVACWLTTHVGNTPKWFTVLMDAKPALVADLMRPFIQQQMTDKVAQINGLYALARDPQYAQIAQRLVPELINALPAKISTNQLQSVRELIACLLRRLERPLQLSLVAQQLAKPRMDVAQQVYWLTAGVQMAPESYLAPLQQYLGNNQTRAAHAYALLREQRAEYEGVAHLTLAAKAFFVALMGAHFTPSEAPKGGKAYWVSPAMENMHFVQQLITAMAADPSDAASQTLAHLAQMQPLKPWKSQLQQAVYDQALLHRQAQYQPATVAQVCQTLGNLQPANAADLQALVLDHLTELAHDIRNGNTNDYQQYRSVDKPKVENDCRDALLSDLKQRLRPLGVNAEPEGSYADNTRADIKVSYGALQFPIEIKRNLHKDLWKAINAQLVAKYSRERSSDGYGIYLVFWFGIKGMPLPFDGGTKPKTPQALQQRLTATVPSELKTKIAVLVIDCEWPPENKKKANTSISMPSESSTGQK